MRNPAPGLHVFPFQAMNAVCEIRIAGAMPEDAAEAAFAAECEVLRIEARYSRYRDDSLLARINAVAASGGKIALDDETAALIDHAHDCYHLSDGLFDITSGLLHRAWNFPAASLPDPAAIAALLPRIGLHRLHWARPFLAFPQPGMELDLGGIGKEYAADRAAETLAEFGITDALVNLGGDIATLGHAAWPVAIRDPAVREQGMASFILRGAALATSGDYERCITIGNRRFSHILRPDTGWPAQGLASVTVVAPRCHDAGSMATIAMLKGGDGAAWLARQGVAHAWVDELGQRGGNLSRCAPSGRLVGSDGLAEQ